MSQSQRRGARGGTEPLGSTNRREKDINRERLVFVLTGLVGHRVTATLRNNMSYEGVFHGCSMEDFSITLKSAHSLASDDSDAEVVPILVIPGKDFLLISADEVPCIGAPELDDVSGSTAFVIDSEISQKKIAGGHDRELVPWAPAPGEAHGDEGALGTKSNGQWDQFQQNEEMFGIVSTFNEDLYTTKLDPNTISREKREQADRIAREIESGAMAAEAEAALNGEDVDEEAQFSAVMGTGYYRRKDDGVLLRGGQVNGTEGSSSSALAELSAQVPLTKEHLVQHDSLTGLPEGDALKSEHRRQRGIITAQAPLRNPMILEMKRINALNLEPALPKLDDRTRNDWISFKQSQNRNASTPVQGDGLKMEFQQSLEQIQKREASRKQELVAKQEREAETGGGATSSGAQVAASPSGKSSFSFNPQAKEFSFNPQAATFTPTHGGSMAQAPSFSPSNAGGGGGGMPTAPVVAHPKPTLPAPPFIVASANEALLQKTLPDLLEPFFARSASESIDHAEWIWPDASGPSFHEVLGQPNPANPMPPVGAIPGGGMPWHQQQQQQQQQAPGQMAPTGQAAGGQPMIAQQGMMVPQGAPGGQPGQMYQPMYPAPTGGVPAQRPSNGSVQMQGQQGPMVFHNQNQPAMMAQQPSMMPAGMGQVQQGQPGVNMGAVPKFAGQVMMNQVMPTGQYQQGYPQVQQPGQPPGGSPGGPQGVPRPGPHGPGPGGPPQGQMMQQPMYHPPMASGAPPHQMSGHEG